MEGLALVAALLASQADGGTAAPAAQEPVAILVRRFEGNEAAGDLVAGLSVLMTERVRSANPAFKVYSPGDLERVLGVERQQLAGCAEALCLIELSGALGARYVVHGRVDRFGDRYVVTGGLWDKTRSVDATQSRRELLDPGKLPAAIDEIADELLLPLGVAPRAAALVGMRLDTTGFTLGLKFSTQLVTSLAQFAFGGDLEIGYRLTPAVMAFFQLSFVTTFASSSFGATQLVPGIFGGRYYFRAGKSFQPYLGAGLGLLVTIKSIVDKTRPSLWAHTGMSYLFFPWLGATLDFSVDLLGAAFEIFENTNRKGVNIAFSLGALFRF